MSRVGSSWTTSSSCLWAVDRHCFLAATTEQYLSLLRNTGDFLNRLGYFYKYETMLFADASRTNFLTRLFVLFLEGIWTSARAPPSLIGLVLKGFRCQISVGPSRFEHLRVTLDQGNSLESSLAKI